MFDNTNKCYSDVKIVSLWFLLILISNIPCSGVTLLSSSPYISSWWKLIACFIVSGALASASEQEPSVSKALSVAYPGIAQGAGATPVLLWLLTFQTLQLASHQPQLQFT